MGAVQAGSFTNPDITIGTYYGAPQGHTHITVQDTAVIYVAHVERLIKMRDWEHAEVGIALLVGGERRGRHGGCENLVC